MLTSSQQFLVQVAAAAVCGWALGNLLVDLDGDAGEVTLRRLRRRQA